MKAGYSNWQSLLNKNTIMKNILSLSFVVCSIINIAAQSNITDLESKKLLYQTQIKSLNDSIRLIDKKIGILNSKIALSQSTNVKLDATIRKGGRVRDTPSPVGNDVYIIETEKKVFIIDYNDDYFKVCSEEGCGYINSVWIQPSEEINRYIANKKIIEKDIIAENANRLNNQKIAADKKKEQSLINKLGLKVYNSLREGHFWLGMTDEMAKIAFGEPKEINETVGSWGKHEQWVYNNIYLYFENGKLTSYQR